MRLTVLKLLPTVVSGQSVVRFGLQKNVGDLPLPTGSNGPFSKRRPGFPPAESLVMRGYFFDTLFYGMELVFLSYK